MQLDRRLAAALALAALSAAAIAHSDDPMLLDRQAPYAGPGWRASSGTALAGIGFPAENVVLKSWITLGEFGTGASTGNDCWGFVSSSGREYAIMGLSNATAWVEVTDPTDPVIVATRQEPSSLWHDIKTYQDYGYAVSEVGQGIKVYDMSQIDSGIVTLVNTILTGGGASTHNVAIDETSGFLYRCGGGDNGLRIYDLADPSTPVLVGQWSDRYVHDAQIVTYESGPYAGRQIAFCCSGFNGGFTDTGRSIVDVTNKANPFVVRQVAYSGRQYSHQCWLSPDRKFLYLNDELDEQNNGTPTTTRIFDVSVLENASEIGTFTNGSSAIDHNLYQRDQYIFASNYRSGLRIFDATDPAAPVEVGFFDTVPENDIPTFNGVWSNYPFLPSGTIIVSDIEKGLFLLEFDVPALAISLPEGRPELLDPNGATLDIVIEGVDGNAYQTGSAQLRLDTGSGFDIFPLTSLGGDLFQANFPAIECETEVAYYFEAQATDGSTVTLPAGAPVLTYEATAASSIAQLFADDMEEPNGWFVGAPGDNATSGIWVRVDPVGTAAQPENDNPEGEGTLCWITGNGTPGGGLGEDDVDDGRTTLTSPIVNATAGEGTPFLSYYRWYSNNQGADPDNDEMPILISNNAGFTWQPLETVTENAGSWVRVLWRIDDVLPATNAMQLRFIAQDLASGSVVEAGVDDVQIFYFECETDTIPGDVDGDGDVDVDDLNVVLANFGGPGTLATGDLNGDGTVDLEDLNVLLAAFGAVCGG